MSAFSKRKKLNRNHNDNHDKMVNARIISVASFIFFFFTCVLFRLYQVHILSHEYLIQKSEKQYYKILYSAPYRGSIFDRNGREMAVTVKTESIYANPNQLSNPEYTASVISNVTGINKKSLLKKLKKKKNLFG